MTHFLRTYHDSLINLDKVERIEIRDGSIQANIPKLVSSERKVYQCINDNYNPYLVKQSMEDNWVKISREMAYKKLEKELEKICHNDPKYIIIIGQRTNKLEQLEHKIESLITALCNAPDSTYYESVKEKIDSTKLN